MSYYQQEPPDEIIVIKTDGKGAQLIYDLVTDAVNDLKGRGMGTRIQSNAIGTIVLRSRKQGEIRIDLHDWVVYGYLPQQVDWPW